MLCQLILKGNPKVIEPLFQDHLCKSNGEWWTQLRNIRDLSLTETTARQYLGFASSQLHDSQKGRGKSSKKFYHALRLLYETQSILHSSRPSVWISGPLRTLLMAIRCSQSLNEDAVQALDNRVSVMRQRLFEVLDDKTPSPSDQPEGLFFPDDLLRSFNLDPSEKVVTPSNESRLSLGSLKQREIDLNKELSSWLVRIRNSSFPRSTPADRERFFSNASTMTSAQSNLLIETAQRALSENNQTAAGILCVCRSGSNLHYQRPTLSLSDLQASLSSSTPTHDYISIYVAQTDQIFSLEKPIERVSVPAPSASDKARDTYTRGLLVVELQQFITLVNQGNHRALEIIISESDGSNENFETNGWKELKSLLRPLCITLVGLKHYVGVANGNLKSCVQRKTPASAKDAIIQKKHAKSTSNSSADGKSLYSFFLVFLF